MSVNSACVKVRLNPEWEEVHHVFGPLISLVFEDSSKVANNDEVNSTSSPNTVKTSPMPAPKESCNSKLLDLLSNDGKAYGFQQEEIIASLKSRIDLLKEQYLQQCKKSQQYIKVVYDEYCKRKLIETKWFNKIEGWKNTLEELRSKELPLQTRLLVQQLIKNEEKQREGITDTYTKFCDWITETVPQWIQAVHKLEQEREEKEMERKKAFEAAKAALAEELAQGKELKTLITSEPLEKLSVTDKNNEHFTHGSSENCLQNMTAERAANIVDENGKPRYEIADFDKYYLPGICASASRECDAEQRKRNVVEEMEGNNDSTHDGEIDKDNVNKINSIRENEKRSEEEAMSTSALRRKAIELLEKEEVAVRERRALQLQMVREQEELLEKKIKREQEEAAQEQERQKRAERERKYNELCREEALIKARIQESANKQKEEEEQRRVMLEHIAAEEEILKRKMEERERARYAEEEAKRHAEEQAKAELYEHLQAEEQLLRARQEARKRARQEEKRLEYERVLMEQNNLQERIRQREEAEKLSREQAKIIHEAKQQRLQVEKEKQLAFLQEQEEEYKLRIRAKELAELQAREQERLQQNQLQNNAAMSSAAPHVMHLREIRPDCVPRVEVQPYLHQQPTQLTYLQPTMSIVNPQPSVIPTVSTYACREPVYAQSVQQLLPVANPACLTSTASPSMSSANAVYTATLPLPSQPSFSSSSPSLLSTSTAAYIPPSQSIYHAPIYGTSANQGNVITSVPPQYNYPQNYYEDPSHVMQYK